jgi:hypothetical protein
VQSCINWMVDFCLERSKIVKNDLGGKEKARITFFGLDSEFIKL